jgi:hypothetical protein
MAAYRSIALACVAFVSLVTAGTAQTTQRIPRHRAITSAVVVGRVVALDGSHVQGIGGVAVTLRSGTKSYSASSDADGIFRLSDLTQGTYAISARPSGFQPFEQANVELRAGEVLTLEIKMTPDLAATPISPQEGRQIANANPSGAEPSEPVFRELSRRPTEDSQASSYDASPVPSDGQIATPQRNRWDLDMPRWDRYDREGEFGWTMGHWWDPFNRNRIKGDKPLFGQNTFFNFTGTSSTAFDSRRLPVPSGASAANPGSAPFFGKGGQAFVAETLRLSFDLFQGDTSFRPVDWRLRVTPAINVNQLWARERGIVNIDVRKGTARTDAHLGLQEAFLEVKLHDLGPNYDFVSVRAGIQQFSSDFRGFIFSNEQPGVRIFGNLKSNRFEYNAAYFNLLEKDTNSGLNSFRLRQQQVLLANLYIQDFFFKGYTTQVSYHFNKDDASIHYDENNFLTRPAPIGSVLPHNIRSHYIGWTGNGHIGRLNVNHAAYQALGHDDLNPVSGRYVDINAQMAALELSVDHDWLRFRGSFFFASGDKNARDSVARGFDSIVEAQTFAGGVFSFFNREGIRLTGTGVGLTAPESFLPNLRSSKEEGQSNFVNPGILLWNLGVDADLTPKLRAVTNVNLMRFHRTGALEQLLFQSKIATNIGADYSVGFIYRPPLSENITLTGGVAALSPGLGLRQIYTSKTLVSGFAVIKFQF